MPWPMAICVSLTKAGKTTCILLTIFFFFHYRITAMQISNSPFRGLLVFKGQPQDHTRVIIAQEEANRHENMG